MFVQSEHAQSDHVGPVYGLHYNCNFPDQNVTIWPLAIMSHDRNVKCKLEQISTFISMRAKALYIYYAFRPNWGGAREAVV